MINKDTISVIMACYNCEATLEKAIDSILNQTYENWVMICCDDGSKDETLAILRSYAERYPEKFVVLSNQENRKLPYSLNRCLDAVKTEFVARMDADDISLPERFEKEIVYLKSHPEIDMVGTAVTVTDGQEKIAAIVNTPFPTKESMLKSNAFSHATIMTYKRVFDALGGYSLEKYVERVEDVDLWCRFLAAGFKGANLSEELYVVCEDPDTFKRRSFRARLNSARTRARGYRLMGFHGIICYKPYLLVLKAFLPVSVYRLLHNRKIKSRNERNKQS